MHLAFQKVKKSIVWGRYYTRTIDIFFLYIDSSHFSTQPIYILQRISSSHIVLMWSLSNFMTHDGQPGGFVLFLRRTLRKRDSVFLGEGMWDLHRNYDAVVIYCLFFVTMTVSH